MGDIADCAASHEEPVQARPAARETKPAAEAAPAAEPAGEEKAYSSGQIEQLKSELVSQIRDEIRHGLTKEIVTDIISVLSERFLGAKPQSAQAQETAQEEARAAVPSARDRIAAIKALPVKKENCEQAVYEVVLGATKEQGGTRGHVLKVGGDTCMPFHFWEGAMPNRPLIAMEVFDRVSPKYPEVLRNIWGELLDSPADMAKACVERYGADLISVRLEGTHPEKGNLSPEQALATVKSVLAAVDVPLIVTGHSHFDKHNEVMKEVARGCAGENLLLSWVEQDNYRTVAGAALAYGHTVVAQSPIDVNIAKQLSILLTNMNIPGERIVIDPITSSIGYGIEYTYSVMERIRLTGIGGDRMLSSPLIVSPGQECAKIKEFRASEAEFPAWGELKKRAALWELSTASSLLHAGASILIMYHPEAARALKKTITKLMEGR
ncbi:acetyl-CoA decarbonylase/synthase complex subunit delta [bacterium]|nr:acetyl-CoA decarbonylase/synthase complex subunit delta [bacterium]